MTALSSLPARLEVDDLVVDLQRRSNRRTLELTVERDGRLSVAVPDGIALCEVERFVHEKQDWVYRKLAEKHMLLAPRTAKRFVSGEGFAYLGRNYRLLLVENQDVPLKLDRGRLRMRRRDADQGAAIVRHWYIDTGKPWLAGRIRQWETRLGIADAIVEVADLGYRWGSASRDNRVNVHWSALQLPPSLIDYVLAHELAHLHEPNHTTRFWQLVARAIPDFERRREALARTGATLWLGDIA